MSSRTKAIIQAVLWAGSVAAVILIGLTQFPREFPGIAFWESLFSTLRLFVFERDLDPFPTSWPLIVIYFAAPLITLSALGKAIAYVVRLSPTLRTRWKKDHVVLCGVGRNGKVLAEALCSAGVSVVGIDQGPADEFEDWCASSRTPMIYGDFLKRGSLEKAGARKARSIVFASGDDLSNLEGALGVYEWLRTDKGPVKLIWALVSDEQLANTARYSVRTKGVVGIRIFDTYQIAATKTLGRYFQRDARRGLAQVSILGFGKFGRDLMEVLIRDLHEDEHLTIRVVDIQDRASAVANLARSLGVEDSVTFEQAAVQDMAPPDRMDEAYFVCTDDDLGNLTVAMRLGSNEQTTRIYVRMSRWPLTAMTEHLGVDRGVYFVNINDLVTEGVVELPGIFGPASKGDLKRLKA